MRLLKAWKFINFLKGTQPHGFVDVCIIKQNMQDKSLDVNEIIQMSHLVSWRTKVLVLPSDSISVS